jgi:hypothetical protein
MGNQINCNSYWIKALNTIQNWNSVSYTRDSLLIH